MTWQSLPVDGAPSPGHAEGLPPEGPKSERAPRRILVAVGEADLERRLQATLGQALPASLVTVCRSPKTVTAGRASADVAVLQWPWQGPQGDAAFDALVRRGIPVIALTPPFSAVAHQQAVTRGAADILRRAPGYLDLLPHRIEMVLERERLIQSQHRQLELNRTLRHVSLDLAKVALNLNAVVGVLLGHLATAFEAPAAALYVTGTEHDGPVLASVGIPEELVRQVGVAYLAGRRVSQLPQTLPAHGRLGGDPRMTQVAPALAALGLGAFLGATLTAPGRDGVVGIIAVFDRPDAEWTPVDRELIRAFAATAATAVSNARNVRRIEVLAREATARAAELEAVLEHLEEAVVICDRDRRVLMANQAGARLVPAAEVGVPIPVAPLGFRLFDADGQELQPQDLALSRAVRGEPTSRRFTRACWPDGTVRYLSSSGIPIRDATGAVAMAVLVSRDITDMVRLEQAKDAFLVEAAHELKTPLTAIQGFVQLIRRRSDAPPELIQRALASVEHQAARMARLVEDLLEASRLGDQRPPLRLEPVDLAALVGEVVARLEAVADGVPLVVEAGRRCRIVGDPARLEQLLTNLVTNAIHYSPAKTPVRVTVAPARKWVRLKVCDTGVGIPEDQLPNVFERFFRGDGDQHNPSGLGLGLYISRVIAKRHGGRIEVESALGAGACFTVLLPRRPGAAGNSQVSESQ